MSYMCDFTDIHCHILPGVDDGSGSTEETKEMLLGAYREGITRIIATPHNYASHRSVSAQKIEALIDQMNYKLLMWDIPIKIYGGNEIYYRSGVAEELEKGEILTLAGSRYVLVEFETDTDFAYLREGLNELVRYGYRPILAHAERYDCLYEKKGRIPEIKSYGVYIQVNAATFLEGFRSKYKKRAKILIANDAVDFVGTDAHNNHLRAPKIEKCASYLYKKMDPEKVEKILEHNPDAVILDKCI